MSLSFYHPRSNSPLGRALPVSISGPVGMCDIQENADMNLILKAASGDTWYAKISSESMKDVGILPGMWIVIDTGRAPQAGDIVITEVDGGYTAKTFREWRGLHLVPENGGQPRELKDEDACRIWGVVTHRIEKVIS